MPSVKEWYMLSTSKTISNHDGPQKLNILVSGNSPLWKCISGNLTLILLNFRILFRLPEKPTFVNVLVAACDLSSQIWRLGATKSVSSWRAKECWMFVSSLNSWHYNCQLTRVVIRQLRGHWTSQHVQITLCHWMGSEKVPFNACQYWPCMVQVPDSIRRITRKRTRKFEGSGWYCLVKE